MFSTGIRHHAGGYAVQEPFPPQRLLDPRSRRRRRRERVSRRRHQNQAHLVAALVRRRQPVRRPVVPAPLRVIAGIDPATSGFILTAPTHVAAARAQVRDVRERERVGVVVGQAHRREALFVGAKTRAGSHRVAQGDDVVRVDPRVVTSPAPGTIPGGAARAPVAAAGGGVRRRRRRRRRATRRRFSRSVIRVGDGGDVPIGEQHPQQRARADAAHRPHQPVPQRPRARLPPPRR